jgi:hypothetical protein
MAKFRARFNGYLPVLGLVTKGDIIEYDGIHRAWLEPVKSEPVVQEELDRKAIIAELNKLGVSFYKGAKTEQLDAMLATHKGLPA